MSLGDQIMDQLKNLEAELERQGWDAPNSTYLLLSDTADPLGVRLRRSRIRLPIEHVRLQRPYLALEMLKGAPPPCRFGLDVQALAYAFEAWMLVGTAPLDAAAEAEFNLAADSRRIHVHPERIEIRGVVAYGRDREIYTWTRERGKEPGTLAGHIREGGAAFDVITEVGNYLMGLR